MNIQKLKPIIGLFSSQESVTYSIDSSGTKFTLKGEESELYLRRLGNRMTVARMEVKQPGQGLGTEIMSELVNYAKNNLTTPIHWRRN